MNGMSRYLLRQFALATLVVTTVLTLLVVLIRSLRLVDLVINRGVSLTAVLEMAALLAPTILAALLPIGMFCGVLFTSNKLMADRELVVMRGAGVSEAGLARPALALAAMVAALGLFTTLYLGPTCYRAFKDLQIAYRNSFAGVLLREGRFNTPINGLTVYVRSRQPNGDLQGILVHDARVQGRPVTWMAERGTVAMTEAGPQVVMYDGNRQEVNAESGQLALVYFERGALDLDFLDTSLGYRWYEAQERYLGDLLFPDASIGSRRDEFIAEGHHRLAMPLLAFGYALIALAALLTGDLNRRGHTWRILAAILAVALLQLADTGALSLATRTAALRPLIYGAPALAALLGAVALFGRPRLANWAPRRTAARA